MNNLKITVRFAAGLLALALAGGAHATSRYHTCSGSGGGSDPTCTGETWTFTGSGNAPSYNADSTPSGIGATAVGYHQDLTTGDTFTQRNLYKYSGGLGLNYNDTASCTSSSGGGSECSPNHAFDNNSGYDMVIFQFEKAVTLSQVKMGWWSGDADFSLFAWTPSTPDTAPPGSNGFSISSMAAQAATPAADGWTLIGSFAYSQYASTSTPINIEALTAGSATDVVDFASSYWAIGAVVDTIANNGAKYGSIGQGASDYFKIASISGCYDNPPPGPSVPEPMSMALVALGLAGGLKMKRKARAQA